MGWEKRMRESWAGSVGVCGWGGGMGANTMPLPSCHVYPCSRRLLEDSSNAPSALEGLFPNCSAPSHRPEEVKGL